MFLSGAEDNTIKLWRTRDASCVRTLRTDSPPVLALAFTPDGRTLATCAEDGTISFA